MTSVLTKETVDKFEHVKIGTLVRRPVRWHLDPSNNVRGQVGIVVDRSIVQEYGRLLTYPVIHWEGQHSASITHPDNAEVAKSLFERNLRRSRQ